jgi:hypothetical protein
MGTARTGGFTLRYLGGRGELRACQLAWEPLMSTNSQTVARFVMVTMGMVIGLAFLFRIGNVL